jgi:RNA polymerase sigma factor (sigma-70 family)
VKKIWADALSDQGIREAVHTYGTGILRLAYAYLRNHADAEDTAQEVFIAYARKRPRFDSEAKRKAWLYKVTANKCKNVLKSAWAGAPGCRTSFHTCRTAMELGNIRL